MQDQKSEDETCCLKSWGVDSWCPWCRRKWCGPKEKTNDKPTTKNEDATTKPTKK